MKDLLKWKAWLLLAAVLYGLNVPIGGSLKLGAVLDPVEGVWGNARAAVAHQAMQLHFDEMDAVVTVEFDERGVPHIFATSDKDAMMAQGYLVTRDRLFQMDFIHRAATGRISELLGASGLPTDRFFRNNGISDAVWANTALLPERMPREFEAVSWYDMGANTYLAEMTPSEWPLEYKLVGAEPPSSIDPSFTMALFAFMAYDLSFDNQDVQIEELKSVMGAADFANLYPIAGMFESTITSAEDYATRTPSVARPLALSNEPKSARMTSSGAPFNPAPDLAEGLIEGKGSNNWAVSGARSTTGMPILAGDMHLGLSLPAIWYEAHLVTPTVNVYGVTFPAVPGIVEGITPTTAWAFTNTGADQLDTYRLSLNETRDAYWYDDQWMPLESVTDSIHVKGGETVVETRFKTHLGPVLSSNRGDFAIKWVGHEFGTTFQAIWDMNRATDYPSFEQAIRQWDYPMQNILYAGRDSVIAIRSTGNMPIRTQGNAFGVQDGTTSATAWVGRVPFDELPHSISPVRGYLTSTNQRPAPTDYPYYLDQDWRSVYRSMRIADLLEGKLKHSPDDLRSYQADVVAVQAKLFLPLIEGATNLSEVGSEVQNRLQGFDGNMTLESTTAFLFASFMEVLQDYMWDEDAFTGLAKPSDIRILERLENGDTSWFNRVDTPEVESVADLMGMVLNEVGIRWEEAGKTEAPWGEQQSLVIRHITRSEALKPLWRGPFPFPGYKDTLSPAMNNLVVYSASWRVVVDFSTSPPLATAVYPGGQSGNPFSTNYDSHIDKYVAFDYYPLDFRDKPSSSK